MRLKPRETLHFCIHDFMGLRSLFLWIWTKYLWCLSSKSLFYPLIILWIPFSLILRYVCLHFAEKKGDVARNLMSNEFLALSSFCVHFIRVCASTAMHDGGWWYVSFWCIRFCYYYCWIMGDGGLKCFSSWCVKSNLCCRWI